MATYLQWNRTRLVRAVTWVCGPEWALADEVADHYRTQSAGLAVRHTLWASALNEPKTWDYLLETPPAGGRLCIVRDAQNLRMAGDRMGILLDSITGLSRVLFVSQEPDFTRVENGGKKVLASYLAEIQSDKAGQLVRCCRPSKEEDVLALVASWWPPAGLNFAAGLLARCGGQLGAAYTACKTGIMAGLPPEEKYLDMACQCIPQARYADQLIAGQRAGALEEAGRLPGGEAGAVFGLLGSRLASLSAYNALKARGLDAEQIARKGVARWQQKIIAPVAGGYDPARVVYCRRLLAMAEDSFRSGIRDGLLESVAALW
jgi:hypothetical protein